MFCLSKMRQAGRFNDLYHYIHICKSENGLFNAKEELLHLMEKFVYCPLFIKNSKTKSSKRTLVTKDVDSVTSAKCRKMIVKRTSFQRSSKSFP